MKIHYVYYAIDKDGKQKIGASSLIKRRMMKEKYKEIKLLEAHDCDKKAGDREIELQLKYFGLRDSHFHYSEMINKNTPKGERIYQSKISKKDSEFIKQKCFFTKNQHTVVPKDKLTSLQLSKMFNLSKKQIQNIANDRYWNT